MYFDPDRQFDRRQLLTNLSGLTVSSLGVGAFAQEVVSNLRPGQTKQLPLNLAKR